MSTAVQITFDQYVEMVRRGDFDAEDAHRRELIRGEIRVMSPIGDPHLEAVDELTEWSFETLPRRAARVRVHGTIGIAPLASAPQPDLAWLTRAKYGNRLPRPEEVLLLIEVADSSLAYDRGEKAALYAAAGIMDYWIVNIPEACLEVYRDPGPDGYRSMTVRLPGQEAHPLAFPNLALLVSRIIPV